MPDLKSIQQAFTRYLLRGETNIVAHVTDPADFDGMTRLAVYANAYRTRLHEALLEDFPALAHALGETDFDVLCADYIDAHPSPYFSLRDYGARLPAWLATHSLAATRPWLSELAALEWALVEAFDAPEATTATVDDAARLAPTDWPAMCLRFVPSLHVVEQHWDILALWHAAKAVTPSPLEIPPLSTSTLCLVWRAALVTRFRTTSPDEAEAFTLAQAGQPFAVLCTRLGETGHSPEQAAVRAAALLKSWLGAGLVTALTPARPA